MSPRDNRPSISAPTQSPQVLSSSTSQQQTNQSAAVAAAVVSNLADSIDTVADHFSPIHTINLTASNQVSSNLSTIPSSAIASSQEPDLIVVDTESGTELRKKEQPINREQLLMTEIQSPDKNTIFGLEMPFDIVSATYATVVAAGGIMGYAKAGSIPSLAAGLTFGGILGVGAYLTSVNPNNYYLTLGTSTVLGGMMGYRFYNSGKFMPAGLVAGLSLGMVLWLGARAITSTGTVAHVKE